MVEQKAARATNPILDPECIGHLPGRSLNVVENLAISYFFSRLLFGCCLSEKGSIRLAKGMVPNEDPTILISYNAGWARVIQKLLISEDYSRKRLDSQVKKLLG